MKKFHLGDILSITTGKLVSPDLIGGVYNILNYMTGDNLYTHALGRAAKECKPSLLRQFPFLQDVDASSVEKGKWKEWLNKQIEAFGEFHEVTTLAPWDHETKDPLEELIEMVGEDRVIKVDQ